jgi:hypothetical protein
MNYSFWFIMKVVLALLFTFVESLPLRAEPNPIQRASIKAKRALVATGTEESLAASREYIRTDSSFYVGWMYLGIYQSERAADFAGYRNAIPALEQSLTLIERDYAKELKTKTSDPYNYYAVQQYHVDYSTTAYHLFQAYEYTDSEEKAYALLRRVQAWDMQKNWMLEPYNMLAWITHRNRFYDSKKYHFLKEDITANEQLANAYLDSALAKSQVMRRYNESLFSEYYNSYEQLSVYHYKCIIHAYNFNIDSAAYYFELMEETNIFPYNNHATFLAIQAKFRAAMSEYENASGSDMGDKRLQEWAYYTSILNIYKGEPQQAAAAMSDMIKAVGSTPGFGWYNIALARACSYNGDLVSSEKYFKRASEFKEVHIGTTLGQSHYEFASNLVKLMNTKKAVQQLKFENKNWWWQPYSWYQYSKLKTAQYTQQYLITNQFAGNPERERVIYKLFSTESVVGWDEIWFLISDFSTNYFFKKFESELKQDKRELVFKYFQLFLAKLEIQKGKYKDADNRLKKVLSFTEDIDEEYEKLFLARCFEALAICADELDKGEKQKWSSLFYATYPQLVPYSELTPQFHLVVKGAEEAILKRIKKFRINWDNKDALSPQVSLVFGKEKNKSTIEYSVVDYSGKTIIPRKKIIVDKVEDASKTLVYGLFGIESFDTNANVNQSH